MATTRIFQRDLNGKTFEVWNTNGFLQYLIDGEIRHDFDASDFLVAAAKEINKPNATDDSIVKSFGSINDNALENYHNGGVVLDTNGVNPSISLQDDGTEVKIGGAGVGGSLQIDFGTGSAAEAEAALFNDFATDLLGKAQTTEVVKLTGVQIGDFTRTVTVSTRDDDIRMVKFKATGENKDLDFFDIVVDDLAIGYGGEKTKNGNISESSFSADQTKIVDDGLAVDMGSQGVGGKEKFVFDSETDAQDFFDEIIDTFSTPDRRALANEAIDILGESFGGTQTRNGNVSDSYEARQIKLTGTEKNMVDLGSHKVGGKEVWTFEDQATALEFIDAVRDAFGVEAQDGPLIDEFIYKVSGGAGISGSPTFVGKDDFIEFIADEFGGSLIRDGSVSESFDGSSRIDGTEVKLGPRGVGGKEVWDFASAADAEAFRTTLDDVFG
jgi:hypothetical protein